MQTRRLTTSFDGLNSSLSQLPDELLSCKYMPNMGKLYLLRENHPAGKVLM